MYTCLVWFIEELRGIFTKSQLNEIFLSKIDKKFLNLSILRIIFNYDSKATLTYVFAEVKKHDRICN